MAQNYDGQQVVIWLEQARKDLQTYTAGFRFYRELKARERAEMREAHERLVSNTVALCRIVDSLLGNSRTPTGERSIDAWERALGPNRSKDLQAEIEDREIVLLRLQHRVQVALGAARSGGWAKQEEPLAKNVAEDERRSILKVMYRERRAGRIYAHADRIANDLSFALEDVEEHLEILEGQSLVTIERTMSGPYTAQLTADGLQLAREGVISERKGPTVHQTNTFLAPVETLNLAQSGTGDVFQRIQPTSDLGAILRLLGEMRKSLAAAEDLPEDEREAGLVYLEQISAELQQPKPRPSMLKIPWTGLGRVSDVAGAVQGGMMVVELYRQLEPLISPMLRSIGGG